MLKYTISVIDTKTKKTRKITINKKVWDAFLTSSSWVIDSGDLYALLQDDFSEEILGKVQALKNKLDYL